MHDDQTSNRRTKRFTIDEANAMLPLVRSIVLDIRDIFTQVTGRRSDLHRLLRRGPLNVGRQYDDEMAESRADLQVEYDRVWQLREELESLGVLLRQPSEGAIEFPTMMEGREAFLCWQAGDESVTHWREAGEPESAKRPLSVSRQAD